MNRNCHELITAQHNNSNDLVTIQTRSETLTPSSRQGPTNNSSQLASGTISTQNEQITHNQLGQTTGSSNQQARHQSQELKTTSVNNIWDYGDKAFERQLAIMLFGISLAFLLLSLPQYIRYFISALSDFDDDPVQLANFLLLFSVSNKLYVLNTAINFYIYAVTGRTFRKDLKMVTTRACACICHKRQSNN